MRAPVPHAQGYLPLPQRSLFPLNGDLNGDDPLMALPDPTHPVAGAQFARVFAIDLRAAALFRFALGAVLALRLLALLPQLAVFWTDAGVAPRAEVLGLIGDWRWSLHLANAQWFFVLGLWLLQFGAALGVALGWFYRPAALLAALLQLSLINRNPLVVQDQDWLLFGLLFWSAFLPLARWWSVDAALNSKPPASPVLASGASLGLLLQIIAIFSFAALLHRTPWSQPDAAVRLAGAVGLTPGLAQALTSILCLLQEALPWLVLYPFGATVLRRIVLGVLALTVLLAVPLWAPGTAPLLHLVCLIPLLGDPQPLLPRRAPPGLPLRIYYERECAFCLRVCLLLRTFLLLRNAQVAPAADYARAAKLRAANDSWVVIDRHDVAHLHWAAFVVLLRESPVFAPLGGLLGGRWMARPGSWIYRVLIQHRGRFARLTESLLPLRNEQPLPSVAGNRLGVLLAALVLFWNLSAVGNPYGGEPAWASRGLAPALRLLGLDAAREEPPPLAWAQRGWFMVIGEGSDGSSRDLLQPGSTTLSYAAPQGRARPDTRWTQYLLNLRNPRDAAVLPDYGRWLCHHPGGPALKAIKLVYLQAPDAAAGSSGSTDAAALEQHVMWRQECGARDLD